MLKCVIIDDEQHAIEVLKKHVQQIALLDLVATATDPFIGLELIRRNNADLVFLDIQMERLNGIELAKMLPKNICVIFCTGLREFAAEAFDIDAVDYIMKPIPFYRFVRAVQKVPNLKLAETLDLPETGNDYMYVLAGKKGKVVRIDLDNLLYIEAKNNYIVFYLTGEKITTYYSLQKIETKLPNPMFIRVHRSFIVSWKKIVSVENSEIRLAGINTVIPIGQIYKQAFHEKLERRTIR